MDILGLNPIYAAILITSLGVGLTNVVGWLRADDSFQPRKVAASALIAFTVGLFTVVNALQNLSAVEPLAQFSIIVSLVGSIAGIDFFAKKGFRAARKED